MKLGLHKCAAIEACPNPGSLPATMRTKDETSQKLGSDNRWVDLLKNIDEPNALSCAANMRRPGFSRACPGENGTSAASGLHGADSHVTRCANIQAPVASTCISISRFHTLGLR